MRGRVESRLEGLAGKFRREVEELIRVAADGGVGLRVTEGYRSGVRQLAYWAQGRDVVKVRGLAWEMGLKLPKLGERDTVNWLRHAAGLAELLDVTHRVTPLKPGESKHQFGLAVDVVPMRYGVPMWTDDKAWEFLGRVIEEEFPELVWGGSWKHPDRPHIESK